MKIDKKKLIEVLKIMELTPQEAIDILNEDGKYLCHSEEWKRKRKEDVVFSGDPLSGLIIPQCITIRSRFKITAATISIYI